MSACFLYSTFACCAYVKINLSAHFLRVSLFFFHNCILLSKVLASHSVKELFKPYSSTCFCFSICFSFMSSEA